MINRKQTYKEIPVFNESYYHGEFNINREEKTLIIKALKKTKGDCVFASKLTGIKHRTFLNKLHQHSINVVEYRN